LKISGRLQTITYEDIFAIIDKLISLTIYKTVQDDIDHLKNRRVRSVGELYKIYLELISKVGSKIAKSDEQN
jgi:DNA-directed RNA polymerase beta subunit